MLSGTEKSLLVALVVFFLIAYRLLNINHGVGGLLVRYSPKRLQPFVGRWHRWLDGAAKPPAERAH
jgi:hypothetical protein